MLPILKAGPNGGFDVFSVRVCDCVVGPGCESRVTRNGGNGERDWCWRRCKGGTESVLLNCSQVKFSNHDLKQAQPDFLPCGNNF